MFRSYIHYNNQWVDGWWPPKFRLIICHWWKVRRLGDYPYQNVSKHIKTAINWSSISNVQTHPAIKLVSWLVYPTIIPLYHHKNVVDYRSRNWFDAHLFWFNPPGGPAPLAAGYRRESSTPRAVNWAGPGGLLCIYENKNNDGNHEIKMMMMMMMMG